MQKFTIRDIENLTGIKAHTLRVWEQRYDFFTAQRKESLHRIYDNEDLKKLLRISFLYHNGWKVSRIAGLTEQQIIDTVRTTVAENDRSLYLHHLIEAALDFDEHRFLVTLNQIIEKVGFEECITQVCYPFLRRIGLLWTTNNVLPAQEHFSSYIIQNRIISETEKLVLQNRPAPEIVLFCPRGELHELPLLYINYLMKKAGWGTVYLGANVELDIVEQVLSVHSIRTAYFHLITNFTGSTIDEYTEILCRRFPGVTVVASGVEAARAQRSFTNLVLLKNDEAIHQFILRHQPLGNT